MKNYAPISPRKPRRKWSRLEWLLLLAPLLVVGGLAVMNFAPQTKHSFQEWRDYGSNRPYAVFWPQTKGKETLTFRAVAFSPSGHYIAATESTRAKSSVPITYCGLVWDVAAKREISSWPFTTQPYGGTYNDSSKKVVFDSDKTFRVIDSMTYKTQSRDVATGHLLNWKIGSSGYDPYESFPLIHTERVDEKGQTYNFNSKKQVPLARITVRRVSNRTDMSNPYNIPYNLAVLEYRATILPALHGRSSFSFPLLKHYVLYENDKGKELPENICNFIISPDGRFLLLRVTVNWMRQDLYDSQKWKQPSGDFLKVFDTHSGKLLWEENFAKDRAYLWKTPTGFAQSNGKIAFFFNVRLSKYTTRDGIDIGQAEILDLRTGTLLKTIETFQPQLFHFGDLQFSPDGKLLAIPQDDRLELWDVSDLN